MLIVKKATDHQRQEAMELIRIATRGVGSIHDKPAITFGDVNNLKRVHRKNDSN